jgi:hypothetical protein
MFKLEDISRDQQGRALSGIAVYVLDNTSGLTVTVYEDDDTTPKANPLTSDANGYCHCRVPAGTYKLRATYSGGTVERTKITVADTATVGSITFTATDRLLGRQSAGGGAGEEITCTAAGRALLDDATAADQRSTLGLGTCATQNTNSMTITGGAISGITDLAVADGGTGASTASGARTNLGAQTSSAGLTSFSAVAAAASADKLAYFTAANTLAETGLTSAGRALLDDADAATQRATLSLGTIATQAASAVAITGGTIAVSDGTAAVPSLAFGSDTDTGLFRSAANTCCIACGGVTSMAITQDGLTKYRFGGDPSITITRYNGTEGAPTKVLSGDSLGVIYFQGYYDNGAGATGLDIPAAISCDAAEDFSLGTSTGAYLNFATTAVGASTRSARMRLDPDGSLILANRNGHSGFTAGTVRPRLQGYSSTINGTALSSTTYANSASLGGSLYLGHFRGAVDSFGAVSSGDILGRIAAEGADGTDMAQAVVLRFKCEGTIAANQVPGLFELHTANASGTLTQALTINSSQNATLTGYLLQAGIFACIHVHDGSTAQSIPTGTTYTQLTGFTDNGASANCTADAANDKITITLTGYYRVCFHVSATSGTNNLTWKCAAFLGGVEQDEAHAQQKIGTAGDSQNMSACAIIDVTSVPADLDLRVRHSDGSSANFTPVYMNMTAQYVGAT